ncbi:DUF3800 domain-containing protein [Actinacidiphila oryziradicis]|uniref:DUF3800 domain-containing protein n=1 Tax=Actinacidiphila oryziradicis TaxID=2571141 RepID=A0A4U0RQ48_9ACTN|nr:DUF3800 domain-containing protein [Actinacidiphila oryziradicis]TJZ97466.1 DUF3800 domain-containing protein [Actinacidiphila oryziradicis]
MADQSFEESGDRPTGDVRAELLLAAAQAAGAFSVAVAWDTGRDDRPEHDREEMVLTFLYERISMGVRDRGGIVTVIFDNLFDTIADEARRLAAQWADAAQGTAYVPPGAILIPYLSASSAHMPGLQLADLVAAGTLSLVSGRKPGLALREPLLALSQRRANARIDGAGLKLWPSELSNLYHWLDTRPPPAAVWQRIGCPTHTSTDWAPLRSSSPVKPSPACYAATSQRSSWWLKRSAPAAA